MRYTIHATDIVGYTFQASEYCPDCIGDVVTAQPAYGGWQLAEGVRLSTEDNLAEIAYAFGIDRMNESTFDSDDFPKVIFASDVESSDRRCESCHEPLIGESCRADGCTESLDDGEGYDGLCGTHADIAEREGEWL